MIPLVTEVPIGGRVIGYRVGEKEFDSFVEAYEEAVLVTEGAHPIDLLHPVVE